MARKPTESELQPFATRWISTPRGGKVAIADELANFCEVSRATAYGWLKEYRLPVLDHSTGVVRWRKRRCDAGATGLLLEEAKIISAAWVETVRLTGKGRAPLGLIIKHLRANGMVAAEHVNCRTGEVTPLSCSAIRKGLIKYGYHPGQLMGERPAMELRSLHPNHCWQIDASLCRQYYLADDGTETMDRMRFYRGKPKNFEKISDRRIWRYVVTDHCTGALEVLYVQGAESAANMLTALIHVMTQRANGTFYGVPKFVMTDPGSGMKNQVVSNFFGALGIQSIVNEPGNARAKGQVENGNYLVETLFESALRFRAPVCSIAEMNQLAHQWGRDFNATAVHTRTKMTRRDGWLMITKDQLQLAPEPSVLLQLPNTDPKSCRVHNLRLRFEGEEFDLRHMPDAGALKKALVVANPFEPRTVRVLVPQPDGRMAHYIAPRIERDQWGKWDEAPIVGEEFRSLPESPAQARSKEIERLVMGAATDEAAKAARRKKRLPFDGQLNPLKAIEQSTVPVSIPRAGTAAVVEAAARTEPENIVPINRDKWVPKPMEQVQMLLELRRRFEARGGTWGPRHYEEATLRWPDGVLEDDLDACVLTLMTPKFQAVMGGKA